MRSVKEKILPVIFVAVFALSRIPGLMPQNFSVAYAFMFCAGVFFPRRLVWWLPFATMFVTDLGLNFYYQHKYPDENVWSAANLANLAFNYVAYAVLLLLGRGFQTLEKFLKRGPESFTGKIFSIVRLAFGGLLGAILFYLITNTASWFFNPFNNPEYAKTLAGWLTALTKGTGGYPTTLEFFRNTLLSGGLFTALFATAEKFAASESPVEKTAGACEPEPEIEAEPEEAKA